MPVTKEFTADPAEFLKKYIVILSDVKQMGAKRIDLRDFVFYVIAGNYVGLRYANEKDDGEDKIKAYWLPWKANDVTTMDLGKDADYFFTSQMTGCRFTVLNANAKQTKVAHMAGTLTKSKRNEAEDALVEAMGGSQTVTTRRLSISQVKDHGYGGQLNDDRVGSAFVYGVRKDDKWTFAAQIVQAAITESFNAKQKVAKNEATPKIKSPFNFT
ncbi:MAG TPA: hypothetical protein VF297_20115 [Pyrinomonadaceae bacterium]